MLGSGPRLRVPSCIEQPPVVAISRFGGCIALSTEGAWWLQDTKPRDASFAALIGTSKLRQVRQLLDAAWYANHLRAIAGRS
jgi:hypothetical protein